MVRHSMMHILCHCHTVHCIRNGITRRVKYGHETTEGEAFHGAVDFINTKLKVLWVLGRVEVQLGEEKATFATFHHRRNLCVGNRACAVIERLDATFGQDVI